MSGRRVSGAPGQIISPWFSLGPPFLAAHFLPRLRHSAQLLLDLPFLPLAAGDGSLPAVMGGLCGPAGARVFQPQSRAHLSLAVEHWCEDRESALKRYGPISCWDVSLVTDMSGLFEDQDAFDEDISAWDVSRVTNMQMMFCGAASFNQPLGRWDVGRVRNFSWMFAGARSFDQAIGGWDTGAARQLDGMFSDALSFNQDLSSWDVSSVDLLDVDAVFDNAASFAQDLSPWHAIHRLRDSAASDRLSPPTVLRAVQSHGCAIRFAPTALRADPALAVAAVRQNARAVRYLSDANAARAAVEADWTAIGHAVGPIRWDRGVVLAAARQSGESLDLLLGGPAIGEEGGRRAIIGDAEIFAAAVANHGAALRHADRRVRLDRRIVLLAVRNDWTALRHALAGDVEIIRAAEKSCGGVLRISSLEELPGKYGEQVRNWVRKIVQRPQGGDPCRPRDAMQAHAMFSCKYPGKREEHLDCFVRGDAIDPRFPDLGWRLRDALKGGDPREEAAKRDRAEAAAAGGAAKRRRCARGGGGAAE